MRLFVMALVALSAVASAQQSGGDDAAFVPPNSSSPVDLNYFEDATAALWFRVSFEERERWFAAEGRDSTWAPLIEEEVNEASRGWIGRGLQVRSVECRETLCKLEKSLSTSQMPSNSLLVNLLYRLGIDHQGEADGSEEDGWRHITMIVRRKQ